MRSKGPTKLRGTVRKIIENEGTVTGEHGIGMDKAALMHKEHDEVAMATMRGLKVYFDPNNILNPRQNGS